MKVLASLFARPAAHRAAAVRGGGEERNKGVLSSLLNYISGHFLQDSLAWKAGGGRKENISITPPKQYPLFGILWPPLVCVCVRIFFFFVFPSIHQSIRTGSGSWSVLVQLLQRTTRQRGSRGKVSGSNGLSVPLPHPLPPFEVAPCRFPFGVVASEFPSEQRSSTPRMSLLEAGSPDFPSTTQLWNVESRILLPPPVGG